MNLGPDSNLNHAIVQTMAHNEAYKIYLTSKNAVISDEQIAYLALSYGYHLSFIEMCNFLLEFKMKLNEFKIEAIKNELKIALHEYERMYTFSPVLQNVQVQNPIHTKLPKKAPEKKTGFLSYLKNP